MSLASVAGAASQSQTSSAQSRASLTDNFDTFLKLLTSQLANQDPLDPLDSNKFTEQLVAYSQVEQQIRTNEQLETLISGSQSAAVSYLGRTAQLESDTATLTKDGAAWSYNIDKPTDAVQLVVRDGAGRDVFSSTVKGSVGEKPFTWDGKNAQGKQAPEGVYRLLVQAVDAAGQPIKARITTEERIIGVGFGDKGATLRTASGEKPFDSVRSIRD